MTAIAVSYRKNEPFAQPLPPADWPLIWARKYRKDLNVSPPVENGSMEQLPADPLEIADFH